MSELRIEASDSSEVQPLARLSERQMQVFELMAKGKTNRDISLLLGIAETTAKSHVSAVLEALDVSNRTEAVGLFRRFSKIDAPEFDDPAAHSDHDVQRSIAVLPFDLLTPIPGETRYSDILVAEIVSELSRLRCFRVASRLSSAECRSREDDAREIGRRLGVRWVLSGTMRSRGDQARVLVELVDAETGALRWVRTYDLGWLQLLEEPEQIAELIALAFKAEYVRTATERLAHTAPGGAKVEYLQPTDLAVRR